LEKVLRDKMAICIFVLPAFIIFTGIFFIPIIWTFVYSFFSGMPGINFRFNGINNYLQLFKDSQTLKALSVNWNYVAVVTPFQVSLGLLTAVMVHFSVKRFKTVVRTIIFIPTVLPAVAVAQMFIKMTALVPQHGLVNAIFSLFGLNQFVIPWLGKSATSFLVLCIMDIWTAIGFYTVIIYGALVDIPEEMIEAARIDGANGFQLFWKILLPSLRTVLITCLVFSFTGTIKVFESATALTGGGPGYATTSLTMDMYSNAFTFHEYGYGSTVAIFILIQCLLITWIINSITKEKY
jgi:raffinose/stachyose/melibiose transport system permease protein